MTAPLKSTEKFFLSISYNPDLGDELMAHHGIEAQEEVPEMITNQMKSALKNVWKSMEYALRHQYRIELHVEIKNDRNTA